MMLSLRTSRQGVRREHWRRFLCACLLVGCACGQDLLVETPGGANAGEGLATGATATVTFPWSTAGVALQPVLPSSAVSVIVSPGDSSDDSWRRVSRRLSEVLAALPGGDAEVSILDGFVKRDLGLLSRRTPADRLIPQDQRVAVYASPAGGSSDAPQIGSDASEQAQLSLAQLNQVLDWIESEPRGWSYLVWILPDATLSAETRDLVVARLLRGTALSHTRLRLATTAANDEHQFLAGLAANRMLAGFQPGEFAAATEPAAAGLQTLRMPATPFRAGFHLHRIRLRAAGAEIDLPWISAGDEGPVPSIELFEQVRFLERGIRAQRSEWEAQTEKRADAADEVRRLLVLNPASREALELGLALAAAMAHPATAAEYRARLLAFEPPDAERIAEVGIAAFDALQMKDAKALLELASSMESRNPRAWHLLAVLAAMDGKDAEARDRAAKAIELGANDPYLYLLLADVEGRLGNARGRADSLLVAVHGGEAPLERKLEAAEVLLTLDRTPEAQELLRFPLPEIPGDTKLVERYAELSLRAPLPDESLAAWKRLLELEPDSKKAHAAMAGLHFAAKRYAEAVSAAREGLERNPGESGLLLLIVDGLREQGMVFAARRELRAAGVEIRDVGLLERAAFLEDQTGSDAAAYYRKLLEFAPPDVKDRDRWIQAGRRCASREADEESIAWFRKQMSSGGSESSPEPAENDAGRKMTAIRGGRSAVYSLLGGTNAPGAGRYLEGLSRTIQVRTTKTVEDARKAYQEDARRIFRTLDRLIASGVRDGDHIVLRVRPGTKEQTQASSRWLELLGFELQWRSGKAVLERMTKGEDAIGGLLATALAVDQLALEEAVHAGRDYEIRLQEEQVPVLLGEDAWLTAWNTTRVPGGFPGFLVEHPDAATLYLALAQMDAEAAETIVSSVGLRRLAEHHGAGLSIHGPALHLRNGSVTLPGGKASAGAWSRLLKAQPAEPARFLDALLRKDDGDALGFYALLASLDIRRQAFFTASPQRLEQFYKAYRETPSVKNSQARKIDQPLALDFFREIPLDAEGKVTFPGSPELWMVVKGNAENPRDVAKRADRLSRATTPDREDQVLLRLLRQDYSVGKHRHGLFENFVIVARLDGRRAQPLDEDAAFLLAELAVTMHPVYGLLAELPMLAGEDYRAFFSLVAGFADGDIAERNAEAGQVHAVLALAAIAAHNRSIAQETVGEILRGYWKEFPQNREPAAAARATLDALKRLLDASSTPLRQGIVAEEDAREGLRLLALLAPWLGESPAARETVPDGVAEMAARDWEEFVHAQQVPSLTRLLALRMRLDALRRDPQTAHESAEAVAGLLEEWPSVAAIPTGIHNQRKKNLERFRVEPLREALMKLRSEAARGRTDRSRIRADRVLRAIDEMEEALSPQVTLAASAAVYARFIHSRDLLPAEAQLFLRRHEYVNLTPVRKEAVSRTNMERVGGPDGSFISGGFEGIARMAGETGAESSLQQSPNTEKLLAAELGAIRATNWLSLTEKASQNFAQRVRRSKDWIVLARNDAEARDTLEREMRGLLSNSRIAEALEALESGDWNTVWNRVSLADLLHLSYRIPAALHGLTPALGTWEETEEERGLLRELGAARDLLRDESLPSFSLAAPYEDSATRPYPALTVSRFAESKVYFAELMAREGLASSGMLRLAEPAIRAILAQSEIAGALDWQAILETYRSITPSALAQAVDGGQGGPR